ncbi:helix-turn-helix transcriptional regulator [Nocardiopsis aegyptia]|uniref:Transcriptional regulator with XRE-family HTH domain n=1 Tax=Nocardiopsis aegyptia TaxID=220378 RepID=A0A7Z0ES17_9ACTN|nr:helix-turn-helix transcriptional regulator [Nocardiopsis aegyptia]NYJ37074.1 transcriptional regulator with XRE-family HTH domain [Nocardiopsis aegyptia]
MASSNPLGEFLRSRRARLDPHTVGLPPSPVPRRGHGLRREEVAALAGVSVDYYARLEQGRIGNVSDQVLTAVEEALRLDNLEKEYLRGLVSAVPAEKPQRTPARPARASVRPSLRAFIDAIDPVPAMLQGPRMEVLAWNRAATILLTDFGAMAPSDRNIARWLFLDPTTRTRYPDWEEIAAPTVAALRAYHDPRVPDETLERLVGELSVASEEFARYWADYRLFKHGHGKKRIFHPTVGVMTLNYETLLIPDSGGRFLSTYTADVGSPSQEKLGILMSWGGDLVDTTEHAAEDPPRRD